MEILPRRLGESLERWHAQKPSHRDRTFVSEFMMDCLIDPYACGEQDGNTGVFTGTAGSSIIVVYVPNPDFWIAVVDIRYAKHLGSR